MKLATLFRGSYKCTRAVSIVFALMGSAELVGGLSLVIGFPLFRHGKSTDEYLGIDYVVNAARGVGLVILGILFLVWSAVLMGCTICFRILKKDEEYWPQSELTSFFKRSRTCTMVACILLALAGVAIVLTGMVFLIEYPLPFPDVFISNGTIAYVGGVMLLVLAVIFFVFTAMLAVCAYYLRRASKSGTTASLTMNAMQLVSLYRGSYKCTQAVWIVLALMGLAALVYGSVLVGQTRGIFSELDILGDDYLKDVIHYRLHYGIAVGLLTLGILFFSWSAILMGCTIYLKVVEKDEKNTPQSEVDVNAQWTVFVTGRRTACIIYSLIGCIIFALCGLIGVIFGMIHVIGHGYGHYTPMVDQYFFHKRVMDYAGGVMLLVLAAIFFFWTAVVAISGYCLRNASMIIESEST